MPVLAVEEEDDPGSLLFIGLKLLLSFWFLDDEVIGLITILLELLMLLWRTLC